LFSPAPVRSTADASLDGDAAVTTVVASGVNEGSKALVADD
jgi:hypothetical protein